MYPGQNIRLSAKFANSVSPQKIERIDWMLKDSSGKEYGDLPRLREIDVTLIPDFVGILNMSARAKLLGEEAERHGSGNIYVVQTKPHQLSFFKNGILLLPARLEKVHLSSVQLYADSAKWLPAAASIGGPDRLRLMAEGD